MITPVVSQHGEGKKTSDSEQKCHPCRVILAQIHLSIISDLIQPQCGNIVGLNHTVKHQQSDPLDALSAPTYSFSPPCHRSDSTVAASVALCVLRDHHLPPHPPTLHGHRGLTLKPATVQNRLLVKSRSAENNPFPLLSTNALTPPSLLPPPSPLFLPLSSPKRRR